MSATPPRHWFSFSLRTLFVLLTVACVWLGWQAQIVHARRLLTARINDLESSHDMVTAGPPSSIPWYRRMLGDFAARKVYLSQGNYEKFVGEALALFPEAKVRLWGAESEDSCRLYESQAVLPTP